MALPNIAIVPATDLSRSTILNQSALDKKGDIERLKAQLAIEEAEQARLEREAVAAAAKEAQEQHVINILALINDRSKPLSAINLAAIIGAAAGRIADIPMHVCLSVAQ